MNNACFKILFVIFLLLYNTFSLAASFDCKKAETPIEKAICDHAQLSELDSHLGQEYKKLRGSLSKENATRLQKEQKIWLDHRLTDCSLKDIECLISLYQQRITELSLQTVERLQGRWQSTEDAKSIIEIKGHDYIDYYDGKSVDTVTFDILSACKSEGGKPDKKGKYLETAKELCYHIDSVTPEELVLMYLPRGNSLAYKKLKDE